MPSILDSVFSSIFHRFLLPTSTPRITKIEPRLQPEHDFSKNRTSQLASIFDRFWCQLGSILPSKIHQNPPKIDPKRHQKNDRFLHRFFIDFWSILEPNLGPCWPLFRLKRGEAVRGRPLFCCVAFLNRFFSNFWPQGPMGYPIFGPQVRWGTPFLVDFSTQFGANLAPSWATLVQELVLDGLVGLREAQRIYLQIK